MTKSKIGVPSTSGVRMPALQYRFRSFIEGDISIEEQFLWVQNICDIQINSKAKELLVHLRQPMEFPEMMSFIDRIVTKANGNRLILDIVPDATANKCMVFTLDECLEHDIKFDYAANDPAIHSICFKYNHVYCDTYEFENDLFNEPAKPINNKLDDLEKAIKKAKPVSEIAKKLNPDTKAKNNGKKATKSK